jgi:hypothetical protein
MFTFKLQLLNVKYLTSFEFTRFVHFESNYQLFTKHFGLYHSKAKEYVEKNRLSRIAPDMIMKIVAYCNELGFDNNSLLKNPAVLRLHPNTLDQYYLVMKEGGFINIRPEMLSKFRTLYRKPILVLKERNFINGQTDVAASFINNLNPCPKDFYVKTKGDAEVWSDVHLKVLSAYLKWRLQATEKEITRLIKVHPTIYRKSFKYLCENITLAEELGFTPEKMFKYGYILQGYPKYTKEVLEKYPVIAGVCMKRAMRMYPKLMTTSPSNVEKIYNILKEHNIPDETIGKRMNVFQLSPETVETRLKEIKRVADFKVLLHNPNILKLVVHHNRAKSRLTFLKELQLKCASVSVLGNDDSKFNVHIREGRDANTFSDIYAFLKGIFKKEISEFENTLKKHPYYLQVPLTSMEDTYYYLKNEKFTNPAILKVIYILLYPR